MNYEKNYNEALERAKKIYNNTAFDYEKGLVEEIFPELKETENEKTKRILHSISTKMSFHLHDIFTEEEYQCFDAWSNAWLEKQGEQKEYALKASNTEDVHKFMEYIERRAKAYELNLPNRSYDIYAFAKDILAWLAKQGEQKPADQVEPKFKIGDWIVSALLGIARIIGVNDANEYQLEYIDGKQKFSSIDYVNYAYDKWTIQDAKDGDVLAVNWHEGDDYWEKIIIFKKYHNNGVKGLHNVPCVEGYGNTFRNGKLAINEEVPYYSKTWTCNLHPATKEQRDTLMKEMAEAGYSFDFDKKELKKVEPKFKMGDII